MLATGILGLTHFSTKSNRAIWRLEKEVQSLILKVVKEREGAKSDKHLLQMEAISKKMLALASLGLGTFFTKSKQAIWKLEKEVR
ncbi:hypothetical protein CDL15_Pgr016799 [Punica granatum]|uniref:Uncharacterized protein n=1 Tax=Punica granatum TaxID=22663 RepID=A0A218WZA7_PUNGR|nr:hypothetical protein CDL15_Pgr016799 [Punica granatum]